MTGVTKKLVAYFWVAAFFYSPSKAEEDAPWLRYGAAENPISRLQKQAGSRAPKALCRGNGVETQSPLDKAALPAPSLAKLTPALAQVAGFVSMVAENQREALKALAVKELQAKGAWTPEAERGFFEYLLVHAEEARKKADSALSMAGAVAGGLTGTLASGFLNDLGAYTLAGQTLVQGKEMGSDYANTLRPTVFNIVQDDDSVVAVIDALIDKPCYFSSTDAIIVLRVRT